MIFIVRIALCDDVWSHAHVAAELLKTYQKERPGIDFEFTIFDKGKELLDDIANNGEYDIYLLDIVMPPPLDGIALAKKIRETDTDATIIFLTGTENFAMDAFRLYAAQYILKPVCKETLFNSLDKTFATRAQNRDKFFTVSAPGRKVTLLHSSIMVVEKSGRALRFHLSDGKHIESKAVRVSFEDALAGLFDDKRFLRVHQSFAINMDYVQELKSTMFVMQNGMEITIPRPKFTSIKQTYLAFLSNSNTNK